MTPETAHADDRQPGTPIATLATWLVIGAVAIGVLFTASVYVPLPAKKPLLFPVALGVAAGWLLGLLAVQTGVRASVIVPVAAGLLIAGGEVWATVETHRVSVGPILRELQRDAMEPFPMSADFERLRVPPENETSEEREARESFLAEYDRDRQERENEIAARRERLRFSGYLSHRIPEQWGRWPKPWAVIFWVVEVLLAGTAGAWLAGRTVRLAPPPRVD